MFLECLKKKGAYPLASIEFEKFKYRNYECSSWLEYYLPSNNVILLFHQDDFDTVRGIFKTSEPIFSTEDGKKKVLSFFQGINNKAESQPDSEDDDKAKYGPNSESNNKMNKIKDEPDSEDDVFINDNDITMHNIAEWVYAYIQAPYSYNLDRSKADAYNSLKQMYLTDFIAVFQDFLMNLNIFYIKKEELYNSLIYYGLNTGNKLSMSNLEKLYEYCFQEKHLAFLSFFRWIEYKIRNEQKLHKFIITISKIDLLNWRMLHNHLKKAGYTGKYFFGNQKSLCYFPYLRNTLSHTESHSNDYTTATEHIHRNYSEIKELLLFAINYL